MLTRISLALAVVTAAGLCFGLRPAAAADAPLQTVAHVDLARYAGVWYEIARYPNLFQRGCVGSMASYTLRDDGEMDVVNSCRSEEDGSLRQAKGRAWVVDPASNARLKVSFFWPFRGDYWIMELGREYDYAVVGTPNRTYLWVLSRTPLMDDNLYRELMERVKAQGFDPDRVVKSPL